MTEAEWLAGTALKQMLEFVRGMVSARKLRLFACACAARNLRALREPGFRQWIEIAERFAEGLVGVQALVDAAEVAGDDPVDAFDATHDAYRNAFVEADGAVDVADEFDSRPEEVRATQCNLLRDVTGNPFRPTSVIPTWLVWNDGTVVNLALGIYDDRDFDHLPILGDALEDAGCDNADILAHCRSAGEHVRGCWVIDLLLGKE
jgi:hypothetical protein